MMDVSDKYRIFICSECCMPVVANPAKSIYMNVKNVSNYKKFKQINLPYSCKLLMVQLQTLTLDLDS